jgi:hypothetical protein
MGRARLCHQEVRFADVWALIDEELRVTHGLGELA